MIILGKKIKKIRKQQNLTQKDLSQGICTQVTISKIENYDKLPNLIILNNICKRLGIPISEVCIENSNDHSNYVFFKSLEELCDNQQYQLAQQLIEKHNPKVKHFTTLETKYYNYFLGLTQLYVFKSLEDSLYYFNLVLLMENPTAKIDFVDVLTTNAIGVAYQLQKDSVKAHTYFEKSIKQLQKFDQVDAIPYQQLLHLYLNTTGFFNSNQHYAKAFKLYKQAHKLIQKQNLTKRVDELYYEMGNTFFAINDFQKANKNYLLALTTAYLNENKTLLTEIKDKLVDSPFNQVLALFEDTI
ncbi:MULTISPECIES: helix-turn-helix domain-containing protein [Carnobacterium]|nr:MULTISPECIES: helix-turn-helix transcriptional regulator [Carnobacterium]MCO6018882.1 helix-turn-helix transcriptional regulator [Carnobacterium divergens]MDT1939531.1 helix-turn-helix transcriptional regulator [Carnobacterium divergens]MDT1941969.1 helix-turn-helix transcriptional regulator [Carnobacterium divergens]MDT1947767.1 helix-turn-helix transcriptional regulator [Carnobacterium divergens]MDT1950255.1 helix-turn-helix transcriptional regulator [Carnobacterium divergens]